VWFRVQSLDRFNVTVSTNILPASEGGRRFLSETLIERSKNVFLSTRVLRKKEVLGNHHLIITPFFHIRGLASLRPYQGDRAITIRQSQNNKGSSDATVDVDNKILKFLRKFFRTLELARFKFLGVTVNIMPSIDNYQYSS
jgi:hypothetical protein